MELSIIIPVYNSGDFLRKCLESIIRQTWNRYEIILINDGSIDNSLDICKEYAKRYNGIIRIYSNENKGVSYSRNYGIKKALGKYIIFIDADDYLDNQYVLENIMKNNIEQYFLMWGYKRYNIHNKTIKVEEYIYEQISEKTIIKDYNFTEFYQRTFLSMIWNKLYEKKIIVENNIFFDENLSLGEDLLFNLEYIKNCKKSFLFINSAFYHYICKDSGLNKRYRDDLFKTVNEIHKRIILYLKSMNKDEDEINKFYDIYFRELNGALKREFFHGNEGNILKRYFDVREKMQNAEYIKIGNIKSNNKIYKLMLKHRLFLSLQLYIRINKL